MNGILSEQLEMLWRNAKTFPIIAFSANICKYEILQICMLGFYFIFLSSLLWILQLFSLMYLKTFHVFFTWAVIMCLCVFFTQGDIHKLYNERIYQCSTRIFNEKHIYQGVVLFFYFNKYSANTMSKSHSR